MLQIWSHVPEEKRTGAPNWRLWADGHDAEYAVCRLKVQMCFDVWGGPAAAIVRERNALHSGTATWDYVSWAGLYVLVRLGPSEGFDVMHDAYERLNYHARHRRDPYRRGPTNRTLDPSPQDMPEIKRRTWSFGINDHVCTLADMADYHSEICRVVEVGTQPKLEMVCAGSPIPGVTT